MTSPSTPRPGVDAQELDSVRPEPSRILWVDYARGIGIVLVVYGHVLGGLAPRVPIDPTFSFMTGDLVYSFHMPLFFVLSGLFVPRWLTRGLPQALAEKLRSLAYPYFVWSVLQGSLNVILANDTNVPLKWADVAAIPIYPTRQFWFFYVLFLCFLIYRVLHQYVPESGILLLAFGAHLARPLIAWWLIGPVATYFVFFALGVFLSGRSLHPSKLSRYRITTVALFVLINAFALAMGLHATLFDLVRALSGIAVTIIAADRLAASGTLPMLALLGTLSMSIYVAHVLAGAAVRGALLRAGITWPPFHLAIGILAGLALPVFLYRAAERAHFRSLLFGR